MENDKKLVYLFGFSPWKQTQLENLTGLIKEQLSEKASISVVLIHDGVIGTSSKGKIPNCLSDLLKLSVSVYAMVPDLKARGIDPNNLIKQIKSLDYGELVDILALNPKIISWM